MSNELPVTPRRHPAASELRKGDIIKIHGKWGEYRVLRVVGENTIEAFGPLPKTGTKEAPKFRTFVETKISYLVRLADD